MSECSWGKISLLDGMNGWVGMRKRPRTITRLPCMYSQLPFTRLGHHPPGPL